MSDTIIVSNYRKFPINHISLIKVIFINYLRARNVIYEFELVSAPGTFTY